MKNNPLIDAVDAHSWLCDLECDLMFEIAGDAAFNPFDEYLSSAVSALVCDTAHSLDNLSPRARRARLNLIWIDFVREQKQARELRMQTLAQFYINAKLDAQVLN